MARQNVETTTLHVTPGADVCASLPKTGVLRFERASGAMSGTAEMSFEDGALALHYADGSCVTVQGL